MTERQSFQFLSSSMPPRDALRDAINQAYLADEQATVEQLLDELTLTDTATERVNQRAAQLVAAVRERKQEQGALDAFMQEYDLSSEEGVVLMCLAEALLRIPDADTAEKLIADKLQAAENHQRADTRGSEVVVDEYCASDAGQL